VGVVMRRFFKKMSRKSLSLVEVAIAIAILGVMLVSMLGMFTQGYRYVRKSDLQLRGLLLAQQRMEELCADGDPGDPLYAFAADRNEAKIAISGTPFFRSVSDDLNATLKRLSVTVSWLGEQGERSITLVTLIADY